MIWAILAAVAVATPPDAVVHADERPAYEAVLKSNVSQAFEQFAGSYCPTVAFHRAYAVKVTVGGRPDVNAMREQLKAEGCGRALTINLNVIRTNGSAPWFVGVRLPGDSLADLSLQKQVWPAFDADAHSGILKSCQKQQLNDVYVVARPGHVIAAAKGTTPQISSAGYIGLTLTPELEQQRDGLDFSAAWAETWPLEVCGHDRTTTIVFIPKKDGNGDVYLFIPTWRYGPGGAFNKAPSAN